MFDCHHLFGTFIASYKVRWEECSAKKEKKYCGFNASNQGCKYMRLIICIYKNGVPIIIFTAQTFEFQAVGTAWLKYRKSSNIRRPQKIVAPPNFSWFLIGCRSIPI